MKGWLHPLDLKEGWVRRTPYDSAMDQLLDRLARSPHPFGWVEG